LTLLLALACNKKDEEPADEAPSLSTNPVSNVSGTNATMGGNISNKGSSDVYTRGVCCSLNANPTYNDNASEADRSGLGTYSVTVTGLQANTNYNCRAYAFNNEGVGYGII